MGKLFTPLMLMSQGLVARALFERNCAFRRSMPLDTGVGGSILVKDEGQDIWWCRQRLDDKTFANKSYLLLVAREFPEGLKGLVVAAMLAAMISSLSSIYNAAAAIFAVDIWERGQIASG